MIIFVKEPHRLPTTLPASTSLAEVILPPPILASSITRLMAPNAPAKAQKAVPIPASTPVNTADAPIIMEKVAPREAPEEIPRI